MRDHFKLNHHSERMRFKYFTAVVVCIWSIVIANTYGVNDILIIGPRITRPSVPKVLVYSKNGDPANSLKYYEFDESSKSDDLDASEEIVTCSNVTNVNFFYECHNAKKSNDWNKSHNLTASLDFRKGNGSEEIIQSVTLSTFNLKFFTMIQTDKPKYKPGDRVNIRLFFIHTDGSPVNVSDIEEIRMEIRNNYDDLLDTFFIQDYQPKVYTHTYHLSDEPFLGIYKIHVWTKVSTENVTPDPLPQEDSNDYNDASRNTESLTNNGESDANEGSISGFNIKDAITQSFSVEKYELTEFSVNVETDRIIRPKSKINLKISGEYSFGKNVVGKVEVTSKLKINGKEMRSHKKFGFIGSKGESFTIISIDTEKELNLRNSISNYDVEILIQFTDDLSQKKAFEKRIVTISKTDNLKLVFIPVEKYLRPGMDYTMNVHLKDIDGNYIDKTTKHVVVTATKKFQLGYCEFKESNLRYESFGKVGSKHINDKIATFVVTVPYNTTSIEFEASYDDGKIREKFVVVRTSNLPVSRNFVNIVLNSKSPAFPGDIAYRIKSRGFFDSEPSKNPVEIFYVVFIGENGEMKVEKKVQTSRTISKSKTQDHITKIDKWMVPSVNMILIAHSQFGEFIYDATKLKIKTVPTNTMNIRILPESRKKHDFNPGETIEIKFTVDKSNDNFSSLHLLSIDERVRYFGNDNDITKNKLVRLIEQFYSKRQMTDVKGRKDSRYDDLSKFNAFIITNAYTEKKDCSLFSKSSGFSVDDLNLDPEEDIGEGSKVSDENPILRTDFPETFLFKDIEGSKLNESSLTLKTKVPDSITSFFVNAFVYHPILGLGIADEKKFTVMKSFFAKAFLPHSIHVGEVMKLNVVAFNYLAKSAKVDIIVENAPFEEGDLQPKFEFVSVSQINSTCVYRKLNDKSVKKSVIVERNNGGSVFFFIRATSGGMLSLKITANTQGSKDIMIKQLKVEPHGRRVSENSGHFSDLSDLKTNHDAYSFMCVFPDDSISNTKKIFVTAYGNMLGQVLNGVDDLIQQPDGCPEQTMRSWLPNIVAYNYLLSIGQLNDTIRTNLTANIQKGYSKIVLKSKIVIDNDSYPEYWDEYLASNDSSGKFQLVHFRESFVEGDWVWNTAYLAKMLTIAKQAANIKDIYITNMLNYVKTKQANDGSFNDYVHIPYYCTNSSEPSIPLTAFVVSALLEYDYSSYEEICIKGISYLIDNNIELNSAFKTAITAYTISLYVKEVGNKKSSVSNFDDQLRNLITNLIDEATFDGTDKIFWRHEAKNDDVLAIEVETASYALMAMIRSPKNQDYMDKIFKIMNWLLGVKNPYGGYVSTHDTGLAIKALGEASKIYVKKGFSTDLKIDFTSDKNNETLQTIVIADKNVTAVHKQVLKSLPEKIHVNVNGNGIAFTAVTCEHMKPINEAKPNDDIGEFEKSYELFVGASLTDDDRSIIVNITTRAVKTSNELGMSLLEIELPSGYKFADEKKMYDKLKIDGVRKVELINEETLAVLYFDPLPAEKVTVSVRGYRAFEVFDLKSSLVRVYSYSSQDENYAFEYYNTKWSHKCG